MKMLRFRSVSEDAWTFCSFAGEEEDDACAILAGRLAAEFEVQVTDDESEDWVEVSEA